eukprot:SAG31_NODE_22635_length_521_cov_0.978673_1_plen_34_part_10
MVGYRALKESMLTNFDKKVAGMEGVLDKMNHFGG